MKNNIPNFFTLLNLTVGFYCIINILNGESISSILLLFYFCLALDFLDGFFARRLNVISEFGKQLDSLADLLIHDYPNVVVELRSHTDFRGTQELNIPLSQNRAQSCVDYLVEKGVEVERLVAIGMSDSEPKVLETTFKGLNAGVLAVSYTHLTLPTNREV